MKKIFILSSLIVFLFSCGSHGNRSTKDYVSAFLNGNNKVVLFGKADINAVLNKADYKNVPKFGNLVADQLKTIEKGLNIQTPIFFALELNSFKNDEKPNVYAFIDVKNIDSTITELTKMGQDIQKSGDLSYFQDGDVVVGLQDNLAILLVKPNEEKPKEVMEAAFEKVNGDISEGNVNLVLEKNADMVFGVRIESLMSSENPGIASLAKDKQEKIQTLVKDCYSETMISFNNGEVVIESKNYMSDELKAKMFMKSDPNASILNKLGSGSPKLGLAINLDVKKMQALMEEFSPGIIKSLGESLGGPAQLALMMGGDDALSNIFTGEIGFVLFGEPKKDMSVIPDLNFYIGFGSKGKPLAEMAKNMLSRGTMQINVSNDGLQGATNPAFMNAGHLNLPKGCEVFGKKGFTGFINFEGMDMTSFELEGQAKLLLLIKYVTFEGDNETGKIVIKAKEGKENIVKQSVQFILKELESNIAGMNM